MINLNTEQKQKLIKLMKNSAQKGNLANSAMVMENGQEVMSAESWVVSSCDASAHSERMLVEQVCKHRLNNLTPGLSMVTVVEPCLMCLSACSQAGYEEIGFIIPAQKYIEKIPWMSDTNEVDKFEIAQKFSNPVDLLHLEKYEEEFEVVFEKAMGLDHRRVFEEKLEIS